MIEAAVLASVALLGVILLRALVRITKLERQVETLSNPYRGEDPLRFRKRPY